MRLTTANLSRTGILLGTLTSVTLLTACDNFLMQEYSISVTNLTHAQPLSPPMAMLHRENVKLWSIGEIASLELEQMAEGGDAGPLLAKYPHNPQFQGSAALLPGETLEFKLKSPFRAINRLSIAGMLVNTNDAFSGVNALELDPLHKGQTTVYYASAYDAGTEFNGELTGTIPGPDDGGEGFNADRDDVTSVVTAHGGIVSNADNFNESTLSEASRFDNAVLRITVTQL